MPVGALFGLGLAGIGVTRKGINRLGSEMACTGLPCVVIYVFVNGLDSVSIPVLPFLRNLNLLLVHILQ